MGFRANAIAMAVPSWIVLVCSAATAIGRNGSCLASKLNAPSYPISSSRGNISRAPRGSSVGVVVNTRNCLLLFGA